MTIIDALIGEIREGVWAHVRVSCGERWLCAERDAAGVCFTVREQRRRQKYPRVLVQTENEDEACRYLIGEKD